MKRIAIEHNLIDIYRREGLLNGE